MNSFIDACMFSVCVRVIVSVSISLSRDFACVRVGFDYAYVCAHTHACAHVVAVFQIREMRSCGVSV